MIDGYYFKTMSMDEWLDEKSGLNQLMQEGKVKLEQQTAYYGGGKVWLLVSIPKDLGIMDSWSIGFGWERTNADATAAKTIPDEVKEVPFTHSDAAKDLEDLSKTVDGGWERADSMSRTVQRFVVVGIVAYLFVAFVPPLVKEFKSKNRKSRRDWA